MPRGIWHALDVAANFSPSLQQSSGLTAFELETLLLSTGVIQWRGEETRFSLLAMENLQATFPTATSLHIQHHRLVRGNPKHYFLCIGQPNQNSTPQTQLQNAGCHVMQRPRRSNQLDPAVLMAIRDLCTLREQEEEKSDSDEEEEEEDNEEEGELSSEDSDNDAQHNFTSNEALVNYALTLRVEETVGARPSRFGEGNVAMTDAKQANEYTRNYIMLTAFKMGYGQPELSYAARERIAVAACTLISYDHGYKKVVGTTSVHRWLNKFDQAITSGFTQDLLTNRHKGRKSKSKQIDQRNPGHLHCLYRYATSILGDSTSFREIATTMNRKSAAEEENETINLNESTLRRWFKKHGGKEKSSIEKPYLSNEQKEKRLVWATQMRDMMLTEAIVVYLDEKWFYTTSRRRKLKYLPRAEFEEEGADILRVRKVINRRHPAKCMFMGAVAKPNGERGFNGKIHLTRISQTRRAIRTSFNQCFATSRIVNDLLKAGEWRNLYPDPDFEFGDLKEVVALEFELDEDILLEFRYTTFTRRGDARKKYVFLSDEDTLRNKRITTVDGINLPLTLDDIYLVQKIPAGALVEEDISCDSAFMRRKIPEIGAAIRQTMPWIPQVQPIYLVMDNAGGHGTTEAIVEYTELLLR